MGQLNEMLKIRIDCIFLATFCSIIDALFVFLQENMAPRACSCGSTAIDTDQSRGISYCTACGNVLEENTIVSEVQFEENANEVH